MKGGGELEARRKCCRGSPRHSNDIDNTSHPPLSFLLFYNIRYQTRSGHLLCLRTESGSLLLERYAQWPCATKTDQKHWLSLFQDGMGWRQGGFGTRYMLDIELASRTSICGQVIENRNLASQHGNFDKFSTCGLGSFGSFHSQRHDLPEHWTYVLISCLMRPSR